jgi:hypothetical protein
MQQLDGTVVQVQPTANRNGGLRYVVTIADSVGQAAQWTTFDPDLSAKAMGLINQPVSALVEIDPMKGYKNLRDIAPQGQLAPQAFPQNGVAAPQVGFAPQVPAPVVNTAQAINDPNRRSKEEILRGEAAQTAFTSMASVYAGGGPESVEEFFEAAAKLTQKLLNHALTGQYDAPQAPQPVPVTPEDVAAQVNEYAGAGTVQVGDPKW